MKKLNVILALIMFGFLLNSCNNDSTQASYPYSVSMTDAPGPYQQVNVDVMGVEITGAEDNQ
jgi:ABC-type transporter Mla subunit MlaD